MPGGNSTALVGSRTTVPGVAPPTASSGSYASPASYGSTTPATGASSYSLPASPASIPAGTGPSAASGIGVPAAGGSDASAYRPGGTSDYSPRPSTAGASAAIPPAPTAPGGVSSANFTSPGTSPGM